jgi:hypothetical protein
MGFSIGTNPTRQSVINYIVSKCQELNLPERLGLATAWTETQMLHFDTSGCGTSGPNASNDWGLMQINSDAHSAKFVQAFDDIQNTDIVRNWQDSVDYGLYYLKNDCYDRAAGAQDEGDEGLLGPGSIEENRARSAYSLYNTGSCYYRYRLTHAEAIAQSKPYLYTFTYDINNLVNGYDPRDVNFYNNYQNQPWLE